MYEWKTQKGNQIELTVVEGKMELTADGQEYGEETYKEIKKFVMAGTEYEADFNTESMNHGYKDLVEFFMNDKKMIVIIPDDISEAIWGAERKVAREISEKNDKVYAEYKKDYDKVINVLNQ